MVVASGPAGASSVTAVASAPGRSDSTTAATMGVGVNGRPGKHGQQIVFLVFMMLVRRAGKITQHRGGGLLHFLRASLARGRAGKLLHGAQLLADAVVTMFQHRNGLVEVGYGVEQGSIHRLLPWKVRSPGCLQAAV